MKKSLWSSHEFRKNYCMVMSRLKRNSRYSGKREPNTPERLAFIREKYKDGVPAGEVEAWITKIEIVDGKDTDLHIDKPVYAVHLEKIKEISE